MPGDPCMACFTFSGLTVVSASGYTGYIGSRERIVPMNESKSVPDVESVWPDTARSKTFLVSVHPEEVDS